MPKTHLEIYVFEIFLLEIIVRPFIYLMTEFEVYNSFLASKLKHLENAKTLSIRLPLGMVAITSIYAIYDRTK